MKISIIINTNNGYEDINNNINYIKNNINENIEIIFMNYEIECKKNFIYESYNMYKNINIINYKKYDTYLIKNFLINLTSGDYIYFLDIKDLGNIGYICKLDLCNKDIIAINLEPNKKHNLEYVKFIYKKEFIYKFGLFFTKNILNNDYLQILKSILLSSDFMYINGNNKNSLVKNVLDEIINNIKCNIDDISNAEFESFIYNILYFIDFNNFYNERHYFTNKINKTKLSIPIKLSIQIDNPRLYYENKFETQENKNLFLVHTPYHILLATSICLSEKYRYYHNDIFINKSFNIDDKLLNKLKCIFREIYILDLCKNTGYIDNIVKVDKILLDNKYNNIFVNNESEVKTQYILNTRLDKNGSIIYIEDGTSNYIEVAYNHKIGMGTYAQKEFSRALDIHMEDIESLGTYSHIKERFFLYPDLVANNLKDDKLNNEIDNSLLKDAVNILYMDCSYKINKNNIIFIALEHSNFVNIIKGYDLQVYIDTIKYIIDSISNLNYDIYIKYHPREKNEYLNKLISNYNNLYILDKNIPMEFLFMRENMILISLKSTSLITFCKLLGHKNAICIQDLISKEKDDLSILFEKLGIFFPKSINEIILKIKQNYIL